MAWWKRSRVAFLSAVVFAAGLVLWTLLAPRMDALDALWSLAPPAPESVAGQLLSAAALVTSAPVLFLALAGVGWWASRRRLYAISGAMVLAFVLAWSGSTMLASLVGSPRPPSPFDYLITYQSPGYPSMQVAVWTAAAILVVALASTMRRPTWLPLVGGVVGVAAVAGIELSLGIHTVTDAVGGALLGALAASVSNLISDVHVVREGLPGRGGKTAAVIVNPAKVTGLAIFNEMVEKTLAEHGYGQPLWLLTSREDPGHQMARIAVERDVDLLLVAGGDGTVRVVLGELADSGVRVGILPSGTGNLLARNLSIPLDLERALLLAVTAEPSATDLIEVSLPDGTQFAAVLAGVGIDANIMGDTNEDLKKAIGPAAYVVAGARHVKASPFPVTLSVDDGPPIEAEASLVSIGNVGDLQEGVTLMPDANAHDGLLHVLVATPHTTLDMAQMITGVLLETADGPNIARYTGSKLRLLLPGGAMCQIDGDVVGRVEDVTFEIRPGAVQLLVPAGA
ncbi:MAG: diacylglycerol kinase family lipid kinase [Propionibacterium sp.]|nr:diacylglycerol kinase family lipid kinase [Propionibacterium sp.]